MMEELLRIGSTLAVTGLLLRLRVFLRSLKPEHCSSKSNRHNSPRRSSSAGF